MKNKQISQILLLLSTVFFWTGYGILVSFRYVFSAMIICFFHEFGHYILAKKYGIYEGITVSPFLFGIKLSKPFPKRQDYLSGLEYSFLSLPFVYLIYLPNLNLFLIFFFTFLLFLVSFLDFGCIIFYRRITKNASSSN